MKADINLTALRGEYAKNLGIVYILNASYCRVLTPQAEATAREKGLGRLVDWCKNVARPVDLEALVSGGMDTINNLAQVIIANDPAGIAEGRYAGLKPNGKGGATVEVDESVLSAMPELSGKEIAELRNIYPVPDNISYA